MFFNYIQAELSNFWFKLLTATTLLHTKSLVHVNNFNLLVFDFFMLIEKTLLNVLMRELL